MANIGASGNYGNGILIRAEEIGAEVGVITRSPHNFTDLKLTTTMAEILLYEEEKLKKASWGYDSVLPPNFVEHLLS